MKYHEPVLVEEVTAHLKPNKDKKFIDATLGDGGHTIELLKKGASVLGIDYSQDSLNRARKRIEDSGLAKKFKGVLGNFKYIDEIGKDHGFSQVDGIVYDLGFSSYQMDEGEFGLSFQSDEPLDMRLDKTLGVTAADLVNALSEKELRNLIWGYSGEKLSKRFAKAIVEHRKLKKIQTTKELADLLVGVASSAYEHGRIHPATRTFMALRIAVNSELENLEMSLPRSVRLLLPGGILIVITFQSLEDALVKKFGQGAQTFLSSLSDKPVVPTQEEIDRNIRARSAKMRAYVNGQMHKEKK